MIGLAAVLSLVLITGWITSPKRMTEPRDTTTAPRGLPARAKLSLADPLTSADYTWSAPENLGPGINTNRGETVHGLTDDERIILFARDGQLMMSRRKRKDEPFPAAVPLSSAAAKEAPNGASITGDGLLLAFVVKRADQTGEDIWIRSRGSVDEPFGEPIRLPEPVNRGAGARHPVFSSDGLTLLITSTGRGSTFGEICMFRRASRDRPFGDPAQLPPPVNTPDWDIPVWISNDGRVLCTRTQKDPQSRSNLFVRPSRDVPFGGPLSLPPWPNEIGTDLHVAADGQRLYISMKSFPGGYGKSDIWVVHRVPKQ